MPALAIRLSFTDRDINIFQRYYITIYNYSLLRRIGFTLATELEDDDSEFGGISHNGYTLLEVIQEVGESFDIVNDMEKLNQDLKDSGIKPLIESF